MVTEHLNTVVADQKKVESVRWALDQIGQQLRSINTRNVKTTDGHMSQQVSGFMSFRNKKQRQQKNIAGKLLVDWVKMQK